MPFFVYILRNSEGRFYIGQTSDLTLRLQRHNEGKVFWTKSHSPWEIVFSTQFDTRSEAVKEERRLKGFRILYSSTVESRYIGINRQVPRFIGVGETLTCCAASEAYMPFFVYILWNSEGRFYIGQTSDLAIRLQRHNEGKVFWTKTRGRTSSL